MDKIFYDHLIDLLENTFKTQDIPVSAIIVDNNNKIIASGWNTKNKDFMISSHAEINAINNAFNLCKTTNLNGYKIISTLEPCEMCYGAIKQAKIKNIEFILENDKFGVSSKYSVNDIDLSFIKKSTKEQQDNYSKILNNFFSKMR